MKKCIWLVAWLTNFVLSASAQDNKPDCCTHPECGVTVRSSATRVAAITQLLGNCQGNKSEDSLIIQRFRQTRQQEYDELVRLVAELEKLVYGARSKFGGTECFDNAIPAGVSKRNVLCWINYVRDHVLGIKPEFPSTEFCGGAGFRMELSQGANAFLNKTRMAYLGSARAYLVYTAAKKDECGGKWRLMAGPSLFLRSTRAHLTLSTRVAYRLADLGTGVFSAGNFNMMGGYHSNFNGFNLAELGFEVDLFIVGFNAAVIADLNHGTKGFQVGIFYSP